MHLELLNIAAHIARDNIGISTFTVDFKYYPAFETLPESWWIEISN